MAFCQEFSIWILTLTATVWMKWGEMGWQNNKKILPNNFASQNQELVFRSLAYSFLKRNSIHFSYWLHLFYYNLEENMIVAKSSWNSSIIFTVIKLVMTVCNCCHILLKVSEYFRRVENRVWIAMKNIWNNFIPRLSEGYGNNCILTWQVLL